MAHVMTSLERTDGDGMENVEPPTPADTEGILPAFSQIVHNKVGYSGGSAERKNLSSTLISLKPTAVIKKNNTVHLAKLKQKEPKFVPYEPYKAAIRPIVIKEKPPPCNIKVNRSRHESCASENRSIPSSDKLIDNEKLKVEKLELERQLKLQVQVNAELKTLLVAAMGEDLVTKVHGLAEDKQNLSEKLINTAKTLSSHQEQVEWLANQCEVWRSKFLASSVMVEELARWKALLTQKLSEGETILRNLMEDRKIVRKNLTSLYSNLLDIRDNFDLLSKRSTLRSSNIIDLSFKCNEIGDGLKIQLLGGVTQSLSNLKISDLPNLTNAEMAADHMLEHPYMTESIGGPDAACNAVVGAAVALHNQMYLKNNPPRITSCAQCRGTMHLV